MFHGLSRSLIAFRVAIMSTGTIPQTCVLSCGDSPLSTASNVIGILTFIYAVLAGLYVHARWSARALRQSSQEFNDLLESLTVSFEEYRYLQNAFPNGGKRTEFLLTVPRE